MQKQVGLVLILGFIFSVFSACNGGGSASAGIQNQSNSGNAMTDLIPQAHADVPSAVVEDTCHSDDPQHVCLAVKYVVYNDASGKPVVSQDDAIKTIKTINQVWNQCSLGFQIEEYTPVNPKDSGLALNTANTSELDSIRKAYSNDTTLLVTTTGKWDRTGSLGNTGANAWTAMPGENLYGAILESTVGTFGNIIAHELGHYVGLDHFSDTSNLMNPVIYNDSKNLTQDQCTAAKTTAQSYWQKMLR